jgi:hypothetical protein
VNIRVIPSSQVIAIAKDQLRLQTDNYDSYFSLQLDGLLSTMISPAIYQDNYSKVVEICDSAFETPRGCKRLWGILLCEDEEGNNPYTIQPSSSFFVSKQVYQNVLPVGNTNSDSIFEQYAVEQNGYWFFKANTDALYARVWYEGFGTDEEGFILIPEHYQYFLADGLCSRFLKSEPMFYQDKNLTLTLAREYSSSYSAKRRQVNGLDQVAKFNDRQSLLRFAQSKINMSSTYWNNLNIY